MVELAKKMYLFIFVALICQKLFFHNGSGGHFGFTPLERNAGTFARDTGAKHFLKGSRTSNQSSKHLSQKMVMKVRVFTLLRSTVLITCAMAYILSGINIISKSDML